MTGISGLVSVLVAASLSLFAGQAVVWGMLAQREAAARVRVWEYVSAASRRLWGDLLSAVPGGALYDPLSSSLRIRGTGRLSTGDSGDFCVEYSVGKLGVRFRRLSPSGRGCGAPLTGWLDAATGSGSALPVLMPDAVLCVLLESTGEWKAVVLAWVQDAPCVLLPRSTAVPLTVEVEGVRDRVLFPVAGVRVWP